MTERMFTVYPMGGWDLGEKTDDGTIILTILYVDAKEEPKTQEELDKAMRSLHVRMTAKICADLGSELWQAGGARLKSRPH
jgi:hypothetical protein